MSKHKDYLKSVEESFITEAESNEVKEIKAEIGDGYEQDIYDYIKMQRTELQENDDLYTVFNAIDNVVGCKRIYERIQSINSAVDVNKGKVDITATAKVNDLKDHNVFETFMEDLKAYTKTKLTFDHVIDEIPLGENEMGGYNKAVLKLTVRR